MSACANNKKTDELVSFTPEQLYSMGMKNMHKNAFGDAIKYFDRINQEYPYSPLANKAQIMEAYSNYRVGNYEDSIALLDDYISLYPGDEAVSYAYYLKALCYYDRIVNVGLDQLMTTKAQEALTEVINRFPETEYARDAKLKLNLPLDHLAGKEMEVGRLYLKKGDIIAAINRFAIVAKQYQTTSQIEEALYRLVECYHILGVNEEAIRYAAVLGNNYPQSKWYQYSYDLVKNAPVSQAK